MFAAVLLLVGASATLSAWGTFMAALEHNRRLQEGLNLAHSTVEQLLAVPRGHGRLAGGTTNVDAFGASAGPTPYRVNVVPTRNTPARGFIKLDVTVSWTESTGARDVSLSVFRSE